MRGTRVNRSARRWWRSVAAATAVALVVVGGAVAATTGARSSSAETTLVVGISNQPDTLDPEVHGSRTAYSIDRQVFDTLIVRNDKTKQFMASLATKWSNTPDGKAYTFTLRRGVTFHDGTTFDAAAVKFNLDRGVDPKTKSQTAKDILGPYKSATVVSPNVVRVNFKTTTSPTAVLDALSQAYWGMVSPTAVKKFGANFGRNPVGTGPFVFKEWKANDSITLVRNADYRWGSPYYSHRGAPFLEQIVFRIVPNAPTRVAALKSGSLDLNLEMEPTDVANVSKTPGIRIYRGIAPGFPVVMWMNTEAGPFADPLVRQAALYAYDRKTQLKAVYGGQYAPAYGPLSPVTWSYDQSVERMYPYNPKRAAQLLDQAGWRLGSNGIREKDGKTLDIRLFDAADSRRGEYLQANLKKSGFNVIVRIVSFPDLYAVTRKASDYDMASTWFASSDPSILNVLFLSTNVEEGFAISRWKNKQLDAMLAKGVTTVNTARRAAIYKQIQQHVMKNALHVAMYSETEIDGLRAPFTGYRLERGQYPLLYNVRG